MISSAGRRSPLGLSRTRMSPLFCCVANSPSSEPVRRVYAEDVRCFLEHRLHLLQHAVGLFEGAARRRQVVDDEAALVGLRQETRAERHEQRHTAGGEHDGCRHPRPRPPHRRIEPARVGALQPAARMVQRHGVPLAATRGESRQQWNQRQRLDQRDQHRRRQRDRQRAEELPDHARQHAERHEHHHRRQRRPDHGRDQLPHRRGHRRIGRLAGVEMPVDPFHHHDRVVDHQADGDRQPAHRHDVDGLAQPAHDQERRHDGEREGDRGDEGETPVAQEHEQDDHREQAADDDRVAHVGDGGGDELGQVVGLRHPQAGRQRPREVRERAFDAGADVEDAGADLLRDVDVGDDAAPAGDQHRPIG